MNLTKQQILDALRAWINQRPGLEFGNYGNVASYRSELRTITRDRAEALQLLRAVELRDSITAADVLAGFRAYSGRLQISEKDGKARLEYCTGQYWPTEYRKAVCAVLASVLWEYARGCMPAPKGKITRHNAMLGATEHDNVDGMTPGDWLRRFFRREFGRGIAARWFN